MDIAKVTSKGQITIPKSVRDDLELEPGSKVLFVKTGDSWSVVGPSKSLASSELARETSDQIKQRVIAEFAEKYDIDPAQVKRDANDKSIRQLLDELRVGFSGVAEENNWESEQDVADFIRDSRRSEPT